MPETLSCAAWNLRVGRSLDEVADEVEALLEDRDLDVLTVCEAAAYIPALRERLRGRYVISTGRDTSGRDSAIISRKGLRLGLKRVHRLERQGWERRAGRAGLHHHRSMVSRPVAGIRFAAVHLPPPAGPRQPMRVHATLASWATLHRLFGRWTENGRRWVAAGDWNAQPGSALAQALAADTDARAIGNGIDWVMGHGVHLSGYRRIKHGSSDHDPVLYVVRKTR